MPPLDAARLRMLLEMSGKSQAQLARELQIPESYVSRLVNGQRTLARNPALRKRLAKVFGVPTDWVEQPATPGPKPPPTRGKPRGRGRAAADPADPRPDRTRYEPRTLVAHVVATDDPKATLRSVARSLKIDAALLCRPLSATQADRYATRLGLNPGHVWHEWAQRSEPTTKTPSKRVSTAPQPRRRARTEPQEVQQ